MNKPAPNLAAAPDQLAVDGGIGNAARNQDCYRAILPELEILGNDQTLPIQSSKPMTVFSTFKDTPPILIAKSNLVGHWTNWDEPHWSVRLGLMLPRTFAEGGQVYLGGVSDVCLVPTAH
jgi:urocanate hydratase